MGWGGLCLIASLSHLPPSPQTQADALRAENARLRAALDGGATHPPHLHHHARRPPSSSRASAARDAAAPPPTPPAPTRTPVSAAAQPPVTPPVPALPLALDEDDLWLLPAGGGKDACTPGPVSATASDGAPSSARSSEEVAFGGIFGAGLTLADLF